MSLKSALLTAIGAIAGILIPGASASTTQLTHTVQQHLADLYGDAARDLAAKLKLDTTGMSGPDKIFAITSSLVASAVRDGFKGDKKVLGDVMLDIAQAAYRASEPSIGAAIVALATSLTANPLVKVAAELVEPVIQAAADKVLPGVLGAIAAPAAVVAEQPVAEPLPA